METDRARTDDRLVTLYLRYQNNVPHVATYSQSHSHTSQLFTHNVLYCISTAVLYIRPTPIAIRRPIHRTIASGRPRLPFFVALPSHPPVVRCSRVPSHEAGLLYGLRSADEPRFCGLGVALEGERRGRGEPLACLLIKTCTV